jgi:hypothetical protein
MEREIISCAEGCGENLKCGSCAKQRSNPEVPKIIFNITEKIQSRTGIEHHWSVSMVGDAIDIFPAGTNLENRCALSSARIQEGNVIYYK